MRRFRLVVLILLVLTAAVYILREPMLRWCATSLMVQDPLQKVDALVVLSGGGYDRGNEAVQILHGGYTNKIICTGGNPVVELKVFNIDTLESDMTVANLKRQGVADSVIVTLRQGTSTKEEAALILDYCRQNGLKKIMTLSCKLHTHRVDEVFREKLKTAGIELVVRGAYNSRFDELRWWEDENGLIAVNNEWLKRFYYWYKY